MRVLLVEDERKVRETLAQDLAAEGHVVDAAGSAGEGHERAQQAEYDVLVLDLGLPDRDGLDVLRELRERGSNLPVLILTARDSLEERVAGLDSGADDYLVKPFAFSELLARLRALTRRAVAEASLHLSYADLKLDLAARRAARGGRDLQLTLKELELLELLVRNAGHPVSRRMIADVVWQQVSRATPLDNVIDVHMVRLRRKVDDPFAARLIQTIRGVGFQLGERAR